MQGPLSYTIIAITVFARQLCLPVPAILLLIAAGGLARQGTMEIPIILAMSAIGSVAADLLWFEAGRLWGRRILDIFTRLTDNPRRSSERAHAVFRRWGLRSLLIVKFIPGLDGITPPLAGLEGASRYSFVLYDGGGSLLWSGLYVLGGYLFARQVNQILEIVNASGRILIACILVPLLAFIAWRAASIIATVRNLRMRRISAKLLQTRREAGEQIIVIDLLNFQAGDILVPGIEGAVRIDPSRLQNRTKIHNPANLSFVLYTSSSDQFRCARVAMALRRRNIRDVWVLEGGLAAWIAEGLPVSENLLKEDEAIRQFGLVLGAN